jgi:hypothetical protein
MFTIMFITESFFLKGVVLSPFQWIMLFIGGSMIGRTVAYLTIFDWLRAPLTKTINHSSGAGADNHPKFTNGPLSAVGELICCPVCSGTWGVMGLLTVYKLYPAWGNTLLIAFSAAGAAWLVSFATELVEWKREEAREHAGALNRENKIAADRRRIIRDGAASYTVVGDDGYNSLDIMQ